MENENADLNPIPNNKKFGKDQGQPSPQAKSEGWQRRRERERLWAELLNTAGSSYSEAQKFAEKVKAHPEKYTLSQVMMAKLLSNEKYFNQYLDRVLGKPQQDIKLDANFSVEDAREYFKNVKRDINSKLLANKEQGGEKDNLPT